MPNISDRLQALGVKVGAHHLPPQKPRMQSENPIEGVLPGNWWHTPHGDVFFTETRYDANFIVGKVGIKPTSSLSIIADWAKTPLIPKLSLDQLVFLDVETTGLVVGPGTYALLIGAGRFEGDQFHLIQFFLQDPSKEPAQLAALEEFLGPSKAVVSFNGKVFDVPLINIRFTVNGFPPLLQDTPHVDLMHLARRIWRQRLPRRSLGEIESTILGTKRTGDDVPGRIVPSLYFDYLRTGDARPLRGVFYHNEVDVISLAALLNHLSEILAHPTKLPAYHGLDLVAVAKLYADLGYLDTATEIYKHALEQENLPQDVYWDTVKNISFLYKRQGEFSAALEMWEKAANHGFIFAFEEMAKLFEHKERQLHQALAYTEKALNILSALPHNSIDRALWQEPFEHRKARLERKCSSIKSTDNGANDV